jgi:hypothetical protein
MVHSGNIYLAANKSNAEIALSRLEESIHHKIDETVASIVATGSKSQRACTYKSRQTPATCAAKANHISNFIRSHSGRLAADIHLEEIDSKPKATKTQLMELFKKALSRALGLQNKTDDWKCPNE